MLTGITLKPKSGTALNQFKLVVEGDTNDADYVYETTTFSEDEILKYLPIINLIGNEITCWGERRYDRYYKDSYAPSEPEEDLLNDILPYGEYGIHSLSIDSFEYTDADGKIYDVNYDMDAIRKAHPDLFI